MDSFIHNYLPIMDKSLGIAVLSPGGDILHVNERYAAFLGYTRGELLEKNHQVLCTPEYVLSKAYKKFWQKLLQGDIFPTVCPRRHKGGSEVWLAATYRTVRSEEGNVAHIVMFCMNVSAQMAAVNEKNSTLEAMAHSLFMAELSPTGNVLSANENYWNLLDTSLKGQDSGNVPDVLEPMPSEQMAKIKHILEAGDPFAQQILWPGRENKPLWLDTWFIPVFGANNTLEKIVQLSVDVTMRVNAEKNRLSLYRRQAQVASRIGNAVAIADANFRIIYVNSAFTSMFAYTRKELLDTPPTVIFGPDGKRVLSRIRACLDISPTFSTEAMAYSKKGRRMWVNLLVNTVIDPHDHSKRLIFAITDITATKLYEILQHKALDGLIHDLPAPDVLILLCREVERLIPGMAVAVFSLDEENVIRRIACPRALVSPEEESRAQSGTDRRHAPVADSLWSDSAVCVRDMAASNYPESVKDVYAELNIRSVLSRAIRSSQGAVLGAVAFFYSASVEPDEFHQRMADVMGSISSVVMGWEAKRMAVRDLIYHNPVTGLANLTGLSSTVGRELRSGRFSGDIRPAALCININRFRRVTEIWGTTVGNEILKEVARRIMLVRADDELLAHSFLDEFVLFSFDSDPVRARETGNRVQSAFDAPFLVGDAEIALSARISISLSPEGRNDPGQLIEQACTAVIQMHNTGRGQIRFYNGMADRSAVNAVSMESRLLKAIEHETLQLFYQPQASLTDGEVCGMEALCRWREEDLGDISPTQFIPLAEEVGLIGRLSALVVRSACRQLGEWRRRGIAAPAVSINLSALDFRNPELPEFILRCLEEQNLRPSDLIVELTETALLDGSSSTVDTLLKVRNLGISLSLDDFGTGHSSLSYLRDLPIEKMKIDRSFVRDLHENELSLRLSKAIIRIGESLGLHVVAEGVENKAQLDLLKEQHYHAVQGYLLAKPMSADEFENWLEAWEPARMFS